MLLNCANVDAEAGGDQAIVRIEGEEPPLATVAEVLLDKGLDG